MQPYLVVYVYIHITQTITNMTTEMTLAQIALEIKKDWKKPYFGAVPYLDAMLTLNSIDDNYFFDSGYSIVAYFLANAGTWRGEKAKEIKKQLNAMLKKAK